MIWGAFVFLLPAFVHVAFRVSDGVVFTSSGFVHVSAAWSASRHSIRRR